MLGVLSFSASGEPGSEFRLTDIPQFEEHEIRAITKSIKQFDWVYFSGDCRGNVPFANVSSPKRAKFVESIWGLDGKAPSEEDYFCVREFTETEKTSLEVRRNGSLLLTGQGYPIHALHRFSGGDLVAFGGVAGSNRLDGFIWHIDLSEDLTRATIRCVALEGVIPVYLGSGKLSSIEKDAGNVGESAVILLVDEHGQGMSVLVGPNRIRWVDFNRNKIEDSIFTRLLHYGLSSREQQ